jgi:hypothetical protein
VLSPDDGRGREAGDPFSATNEPHSLVRLPLDTYVACVDAECASESRTHVCSMRRNLRSFGDDDDVYVGDSPSRTANADNRGGEHLDGVTIAIRRILIGEHLPDVAECGCSQHGVSDGVRDRIAIRVTVQVKVALDANAAQHEWSTWLEPVGIVADSSALHSAAAGRYAATGSAGAMME